jgi:hypothetical protein
MRYRVLPYRQGSKGAKALAEALGGKVLKLEGSKFVPKEDDVIINWGNTQPTSQACPALLVYGEELSWDNYYNSPGSLNMATNKKYFFQTMEAQGHGDIIPPFWTSQADIPDDAFPIVCRTQLAGHSGAGIVIASTRGQLVAAPLYTQYIKKQDEYRIHVGTRRWAPHLDYAGEPMQQGEFRDDPTTIIAVQRKARSSAVADADVNWQVRSHANGFVFVREGFTAPARVLDAARLALGASGLDFGAVDVIWNANQERAYVLEINTAPGLEGQTIEDYANYFRAG